MKNSHALALPVLALLVSLSSCSVPDRDAPRQIAEAEAISIAEAFLEERGVEIPVVEATREEGRWRVFFQYDTKAFGGGATVIVDSTDGSVIDAWHDQ